MEATINSDILRDLSSGAQTTGLKEGLFVFNERGLMLQCSGADSVLAFAGKVPAEAMDAYDPGGGTEFGLAFDKIDGFATSSDALIQMEIDDSTLIMDDGQFSAEMATVQPQYVEGVMEKVPSIEYELTIKDQPDFLTDFISRVDNLFEPSTYMVGAREDGVYLYSEDDNSRADAHFEWDDFEGYNLNWEADNGIDVGGNVPSEDHAMDVRMSMDFSKSLKSLGGDSILRFSNQGPMKWVFGQENGVKMSYFQAPRISDERGSSTLPKSVTGGDEDDEQLQLS